ncbi:hypothetical protein HMPREF3214_00207 [Alloscardovia omnicolens]|nr:hypothetical protein HMPREF3214_00207 [Alloscardovia omnicolens]
MCAGDMRNRCATCEVVFPHHKWRYGCINRLSEIFGFECGLCTLLEKHNEKWLET